MHLPDEPAWVIPRRFVRSGPDACGHCQAAPASADVSVPQQGALSVGRAPPRSLGLTTKGDQMFISEMLNADHVSPEIQERLFAMYKRRGDHNGMARLCQLTDLDPAIDAKLAKENAAGVRAEWLKRPGRSIDELTAVLRKEKRVKVLIALCSLELPEACYAIIASANDSTTVSLAVMQSERATTEAKKIVAANLARNMSSLRRGDHGLVRDTMLAHPELAAAFSREAKCFDALMTAVLSEDLDSDTAALLVGRIGAFLDKAGKQAATNMRYDNVLHKAQNLISHLRSCSWVCDDVAATLNVHLEAFVAAITKAKAKESDQWRRNSYDRIITDIQDAIATFGGEMPGGQAVSKMVQRASQVSPEDVDDLIETARNLPAVAHRAVYMALMRNPGLSIQTRAKIQMPGVQLWEILRGKKVIETLDRETLAALMLAQGWTLSLQMLDDAGVDVRPVIELMLQNLTGVDQHTQVRLLNQLVMSRWLDATLLSFIPVQLLRNALECGGVDPTVRAGLAERMQELLAPLPPEAWDAFERMSGNFPGTIDELVRLCAATTAG